MRRIRENRTFFDVLQELPQTSFLAASRNRCASFLETDFAPEFLRAGQKNRVGVFALPRTETHQVFGPQRPRTATSYEGCNYESASGHPIYETNNLNQYTQIMQQTGDDESTSNVNDDSQTPENSDADTTLDASSPTNQGEVNNDSQDTQTTNPTVNRKPGTVNLNLTYDPNGNLLTDGMNWYAFVNGNPVSNTDPSGLCPLENVRYTWGSNQITPIMANIDLADPYWSLPNPQAHATLTGLAIQLTWPDGTTSIPMTTAKDVASNQLGIPLGASMPYFYPTDVQPPQDMIDHWSMQSPSEINIAKLIYTWMPKYGPNDWKSSERPLGLYDNTANFMYGATGAAFGFREWPLQAVGDADQDIKQRNFKGNLPVNRQSITDGYQARSNGATVSLVKQTMESPTTRGGVLSHFL